MQTIASFAHADLFFGGGEDNFVVSDEWEWKKIHIFQHLPFGGMLRCGFSKQLFFMLVGIKWKNHLEEAQMCGKDCAYHFFSSNELFCIVNIITLRR